MTRPGPPAGPGLRHARGRIVQTSWAPAVLLAHLAVLGLAAVVVIALWQAGIGSRSELLRAPVPVQLVGWVLAGAFVVLVLVQPPD